MCNKGIVPLFCGQLFRYLYDKTSAVRQRLVADFIVQYALSKDGLRDEILLQLCNLAFYESIDEEHSHNIWTLIAHCLSCWKPSPSLFNYFLKLVCITDRRFFCDFESRLKTVCSPNTVLSISSVIVCKALYFRFEGFHVFCLFIYFQLCI